MSFTFPVFTSEDLLTEAPEEEIKELLETTSPISITADTILMTRDWYQALAKKLVWFGASRAGLMNAASAVFDAPAHPPIFDQHGQPFIVYGDYYYDAYGYSDQSWSWNTDAKIYAGVPAPDPEPQLLERFRALDLFFKLIGSPVEI